jgi:hypothetical protein
MVGEFPIIHWSSDFNVTTPIFIGRDVAGVVPTHLAHPLMMGNSSTGTIGNIDIGRNLT